MFSNGVRSPKLRELIQPLGPTVCQTRPLETADRVFSGTDVDFVVVTNLSERPIGVLTHRDLEDLKQSHPGKWHAKRCACAVKEQRRLQLDDLVDDVIKLYNRGLIRPLLVFDGDAVLGVLRPTEVFQWCAENRPDALERLAFQARHH